MANRTPANPTFLVVDDLEDNRLLVCRELRRKFPRCELVECADSDEAAAALQKKAVTAVITHRALDLECLPLIQKMRGLTKQPILTICGTCNETEARGSGSDAFVDFHAWLRVGAKMEDLLARTDCCRGGC